MVVELRRRVVLRRDKAMLDRNVVRFFWRGEMEVVKVWSQLIKYTCCIYWHVKT